MGVRTPKDFAVKHAGKLYISTIFGRSDNFIHTVVSNWPSTDYLILLGLLRLLAGGGCSQFHSSVWSYWSIRERDL